MLGLSLNDSCATGPLLLQLEDIRGQLSGCLMQVDNVLETPEGLILSEAQLEHIKAQVLAALQSNSSHQAPSVKAELAVGGELEGPVQEKVSFVLLARLTRLCETCPRQGGKGLPALD